MKQFTTIKIGYTMGINGRTGEYFTTIYINGGKTGSFCFGGLFGAEQRISGEMKKKGFKEFYTPSFYAKMTRSNLTKYIKSENDAIEYVRNGFKNL